MDPFPKSVFQPDSLEEFPHFKELYHPAAGVEAVAHPSPYQTRAINIIVKGKIEFAITGVEPLPWGKGMK